MHHDQRSSYCQWSQTVKPSFNSDTIALFVGLPSQCGCCYIVCWRESGEGSCLKFDFQGQEGEKILDVDGQGVGGSWKFKQFSWTSYVYCPISEKHFEAISSKIQFLFKQTKVISVSRHFSHLQKSDTYLHNSRSHILKISHVIVKQIW